MPSNNRKEAQKTALRVVKILDKTYPEAHQELKFTNAFELLIATILAAQCTDAKVNQVTEKLFDKYKSAKDYIAVGVDELREDIQGITFSGNKARYLQSCCRTLVNDHNGEVPKTVEELTRLPGVGRKTANIVLSNALGIPAIGVDTHTIRVPNRLGWVDEQNPDKIEQALCDLLPREMWHRGNIVIQWHGRYTCKAKKPHCDACAIYDFCEWQDKT
ncbi:endonuclease III [bacterium]|nr:endonuclease III [bacterium]